MNYDFRRGNLEGNSKSRVNHRKDSKKSTNNQQDTVLDIDNTVTQ